MAFVKITLIYNGDRFKTEVDDKASIPKLIKLFRKELKLNEGNFLLAPLTEKLLENGAEWELIKRGEDSLLKSFGKE